MAANNDEMLKAAMDSTGKEFTAEQQKIFAEAAKKLDEGASLLEAIGLNEEHVEWVYAQAYAVYKMGKYQDAALVFKLLIQMDRRQEKYYLGLGACYFMQKKYNLALFPYLAAHELNRLNPVTLYYIVECYLKMDDKLAALETYNELLDVLEGNLVFQQMKERIVLAERHLREELGFPPREQTESKVAAKE